MGHQKNRRHDLKRSDFHSSPHPIVFSQSKNNYDFLEKILKRIKKILYELPGLASNFSTS